MSNARDNILQRLRGNRVDLEQPEQNIPPLEAWSAEQRITRFTENQEAVHGEVHTLPTDQWIDWLAEELPKRGLHQVLTGTGDTGTQLGASNIESCVFHQYDQPIESWKPELFSQIDVAITGSRCGIAETGTLVLMPDRDEPRLMSLVPPVHIALLEATKLYQSFAEVIEEERWADGLPTNTLLISGPSKTADIEQTLAYGIHGPKQLITLLLV
ncbi:MAG: lactate utilization protein [Candidatus Thiodiazotropha lotti]|nr:lactate utilization protein [Candidatus Thiodiazotropha lotti]MCG8004533.1 lactate utilization protein [Candidatus Thiodiazotropha lotti]MCG8008910.1 lactate utilization protein [Candidatus Thiodiazotropha lotti]MCW4188157.1 lactate utilization protein [Candidatus Thiodiazotropha lotti]MCW4196500.1 lactate utilization protein [Candidatus Thiodiazotropha lotti]